MFKNCSNCGSEFEPDTNKRKLCVSCRNYYKRNAERVKERVKAAYYKDHDGVRATQAKYKEKTGYNSKYYTENKERLRSRAQESNWRSRQLIASLKSGPCMDCGGKFPSVCMDFDHRDPSTKIRAVSAMGRQTEEAIRSEIAKCDLVCANCHRIRTAKAGGFLL